MVNAHWTSRGLYEKWSVTHRRSPNRHANCAVFVLDPRHDKYAAVALEAYAKVVDLDNSRLAADLRELAKTEVEPRRVYAGPTGAFVVEPGMHWDPAEAAYCGCGAPGSHL